MTETPSANAAEAEQEPTTPDVLPQFVEGCRLLEAKDFHGALAKLQEALSVRPDDPAIYFSLGLTYRELDRFEEACQALRDCLQRNPRHRSRVYHTLAHSLERLERLDEAETHYRQAIEEHYQCYAAHFELGMLLLRQGRWPEGFREYDWRWQTSTFQPFRCLQPRWKGHKFDGTLLVHTEQGVGDTLQFCRFLPLIRERCQRLVFVCSERLQPMFPAPHWADSVLQPGTLDDTSFDAYLPLMSAPFVLGTDLDTIPSRIPYLTPAPRTIDLPESHVPTARLKVGIVWGGSPTHAHDQYRSCRLSDWTPVLDVPQVAFYSLQTPPQREQLAELPSPHCERVRDLDDLQHDFSDTAAMLRQLDLLITVDTAILHLAGGLGLPVWGLLNRIADWRWLQDREDSDWYPTLRLFRQRELRKWDHVMARVADALREKVDAA